jgi:hypothetical protein
VQVDNSGHDPERANDARRDIAQSTGGGTAARGRRPAWEATVSSTDDPSRQREIEQLEQDLANLRRRYAALEQAVRFLRWGFWGYVIVLTGLIGWAVIIVRNGNLAVALVILLIILVVGARIGPGALRPSLTSLDRKPRWIDAIGRGPPRSFGVGVKRSEATAIEDMIADRQRRLAALRGEPPEAEPAR